MNQNVYDFLTSLLNWKKNPMRIAHIVQRKSSGFKPLACGASSPGSNPGLATWISEIWYLLLPSCDMTDIFFIWRHKILKAAQPTILDKGI